MSQFENYFPTILCIVPTVSLPPSSYVVVAPNELPRHSQIPGLTLTILTSLTNRIDFEYRNNKKNKSRIEINKVKFDCEIKVQSSVG